MKTRDGEALAGGASALSDFAEVGNAVAPAPQYGQPTAPTQGYATPTSQVNPVTGRPMATAPGINPITGQPM